MQSIVLLVLLQSFVLTNTNKYIYKGNEVAQDKPNDKPNKVKPTKYKSIPNDKNADDNDLDDDNDEGDDKSSSYPTTGANNSGHPSTGNDDGEYPTGGNGNSNSGSYPTGGNGNSNSGSYPTGGNGNSNSGSYPTGGNGNNNSGSYPTNGNTGGNPSNNNMYPTQADMKKKKVIIERLQKLCKLANFNKKSKSTAFSSSNDYLDAFQICKMFDSPSDKPNLDSDKPAVDNDKKDKAPKPIDEGNDKKDKVPKSVDDGSEDLNKDVMPVKPKPVKPMKNNSDDDENTMVKPVSHKNKNKGKYSY